MWSKSNKWQYMKRFILFITIFIHSCIANSSNSQLVQENINVDSPPKLKIAICYWGLTRSTKAVYKSHYEKIFDILDQHGIEYDVFMHTWRMQSKQRVNTIEIDTPIDYEEYKLLNPKYYQIDDQDLFTSSLNFDNYFYQDAWDKNWIRIDGEWLPNLILNHLCALESQKRVTEMVINSKNEYDLIMYVRPDVYISNNFPIHTLYTVNPNDILIPDFAHNEGYNDRFAVLDFQTAPIYSMRINEIIDFRKTQGRIVSEKYVKYICDYYNLNVKFIDFFFDIIRPPNTPDKTVEY